MARVVCQVLPRADRWTFLWSEGDATFAPYNLEGASLAELLKLAQQTHQQLALFGAGADDPAATARTGHQLAQFGHGLNRLLFQLDGPENAPGKEICSWLEALARAGNLECLEILGDTFTIPWTAVYGVAPDQAAFASAAPDAECWKGFWGRRFPLLGGRRVQWLRGRQLPEKPGVVLAIDPVLRASLPAEEQKRLGDFQAAHELTVAESPANLAKVFQSQEVDLLYIFARTDGNAVLLGNDRLTADALASDFLAVVDGEAVSGQTVVVLNSCPGGETGNPLAAFERFAGVGLLGAVQPVAGPLANRAGLELLTQFLGGGQTLAQALAAVRQRHPVAGLLYFGCCPGDLRAGSPDLEQDGVEPLELPDEPYQPLTALDEASAALLVGREFDIAQVGALLDESGACMVLTHGLPAVGKASLIHAGLVPYLEDQCVGYRFLRERADSEPKDDERAYPILPIRASSDLAGQLAIALLEFCGRPYGYVTPAGKTVNIDLAAVLHGALGLPSVANPAEALPTAEELRVALRHDASLLSQILAAVTGQLPFELVLLIEQGEELFSLAGAHAESGDAQQAIAMLRAAMAGPARAKFIVSLRTDYLGRYLDSLLQTPEDNRHVRSFLVRELTEDELMEVVLQPTSVEPLAGSEEIPQQAYRFQFEQGLAKQIAGEARRLGAANQESPLALVHVVCSRLFGAVAMRQDRVVRAADLKAIGGVENGLSKYVATLVQFTTSRSDRKAFKKLLLKLFVRQPDGAMTRNLLFEDDLEAEWRGSGDFDELVAKGASDDIRLLEVNYLNVGGKEGNFVSLGHEALASVIAHESDEAGKRTYGRSKFTDALWITVPLLILLGVYAATRLYRAAATVAELKDDVKASKELVDKIRPRISAMRWPAYGGLMRAADQAMRAGDLVRARQALLSLKPMGKSAEDEADMRGFDWFHLWHQMHLDQATVFGHRGTVNSVALTADGTLLATTSEDGTVRLWSAMDGRELAKWELKDKIGLVPGHCVAFSPDGGLLAASGRDGVIRLWEVRTARLDSAPGAAGVVAVLSPMDALPLAHLGQLTARALATSVVHRADLTDHKEAVLVVAFSPDGKTLASAGMDGTVKLWDLAEKSPKMSKSLTEHKGPVNAVAFSPDGSLLASAGADKKVLIWDTKSAEVKNTLQGRAEEVHAVAWSGDGKSFATAGTQSAELVPTGFIDLWDTATWKPAALPTLMVAPVFALSFADDGKSLAAAGKDNFVHFWDPATGQERQALRGHLGWVRSLAVARGGAVIASGSYDGTAKVWLPQQREKRDLLKVSIQPVAAVAFSPDDRWLATASGDGKVKLFSVSTGDQILELPAHKGAALALTWAMDGKALASGGADGQLKIWDMDKASKSFGTELDAVQGHTKEITCLAWNGKDGRLVSGSLDGFAKVWKVEAGKLDKKSVDIDAKNAIYCLYLLQQSEFLATGHDDGKTCVWNTTTGMAFKIKEPVFSGHTGRVTGIGLVITEEREPRLITASMDQSIKFWHINTNTGTAFYTSRGHGGPVTCLAVLRDRDETLVTGSTDNTVKLWDPHGQEERWTLRPQIGAVRAVAISSDAGVIAAAGQDGSVRLFRTGKD